MAVAIGAFAICFYPLNFAKPIDGKKTNKSCIYCHTKYGSEELTEAGKYYREKATLDGYKKRQTSFSPETVNFPCYFQARASRVHR